MIDCTMRKLLFLGLAVIGFAACQEKELVLGSHSCDADIYASMEAMGATRTSMDQYNDVLWSDSDQIAAFLKTTLGLKYQIKEQYVGTRFGGFSKVAASGSDDDLDSGMDIDHNVAVYPYSDAVWCMKNGDGIHSNSYKVNVVLPQTQSYAENSFGEGAFPMIAISSSSRFSFKNICGGVKLRFKGVDRIKSIKLEGLANEKISGKASVVGYVDGSAPSITMASGAFDNVILECNDGVQLTPDVPVTFIIAVPPVDFKSGMKITVTDVDGECRTFTNTSPNTIRRSTLLTFPEITYAKPVPAELIMASEYAQLTDESGVYEVKIQPSLVNGVCTVAPFDLSCCLYVTGDTDADHKVSFEVIDGYADIKNPVTAVLPLDEPVNDPSVGEVTARLARNNSLLTWDYSQSYVKVKATLWDEDSPVDDAVLILSVEDPLMFSVNDIYCTAVDGNAAIRVYQALSLKSSVEEHREVTNLLDVNAGSFADILADEYMFAYGIAINIDLYWIYCYDDYGVMDSLPPTKYVWDSADGILTINDSEGTAKSIHAEFRVSFAHDFMMCTCPKTSTLRVTIR